jgi:uncharacterized protein (DUF1778 family)
MASPLKNDRLELRLTSEQKRTIEQAASISGRTVTDFSVPLLVEEAAEVLRRERDLHLSAEAWEAFQEVLDRPAASVAELAALLQRPSVFSE